MNDPTDAELHAKYLQTSPGTAEEALALARALLAEIPSEPVRSTPAPITIVPCPSCGNRSRHERRRCRAKAGPCRGSGFVRKTIWLPGERDALESDQDSPKGLA